MSANEARRLFEADDDSAPLVHVTAEKRPPQLERLITASELSDRIGLSKPRIYQLARKGQIPVVSLGRAYKFSPIAIERWIADGGNALTCNRCV